MIPYIGFLLLLSMVSQAAQDLGCVSPLTTTYIPVGGNKRICAAVPTGQYPLIEERDNDYLVLLGSKSAASIGLIPKRDNLSNPTADIRGGNVAIRTIVNVGIYEGLIPLDPGKRYPVISETPSIYRVAFKFLDYVRTVDLPKTNCIFISAGELRKEQEDVIAKCKMEEEKRLALKAATEERRAQAAKERKDTEERAAAARETQERFSRERKEKEEQQEEQRQQRLIEEEQYAKAIIIDLEDAQTYAEAKSIATKALKNVTFPAVAEEIVLELANIRDRMDRKVRAEKALRVGLSEVPEAIDGILRDQARGDIGSAYWSSEASPVKLFAPTAWEIVSTDLQGPDATVRVRIDSSNQGGAPIRKIWIFLMTFEDRWQVFRIYDE